MKRAIWIALFLLLSGGGLRATETENLGIQILPAPGKMAIDGKFSDWDLSGGLFVCGDVESTRDTFAVWIHAMYDPENLYILARFRDATPLNNPGQAAADYGFSGDSLQVRIITAVGTARERGNHFTCWRDRDGKGLIKVEKGTTFKEGFLADAKKEGAQQAFTKDADGKGYIQEIALPWKLLTRDGKPLKTADTLRITVEPNFTIGLKGRLSLKDIFLPGVQADRVFTFMAYRCWGQGSLESHGKVTPRPVRLADGREFTVRLENGLPVVDWTGLIKSKELAGFKPIVINMPEDGYVSLNIRDGDGLVRRQLLHADFLSKGKHVIQWDGLTTPSWNRPGVPVPAGSYTWQAIYHTGIGLRLRGWACNAGTAPWDGPSGKDNWGGDHGLPSACAADENRVYLGWSGAEAGKAVLACDLEGKVLWSNNRAGIAGTKGLAADQGVLYVLGGAAGLNSDGGAIYKLDAKSGSYLTWGGDNQADLVLKNLGENVIGASDRADAIAAHDGVLFLSFLKADRIVLVDAKTGAVKRVIAKGVAKPGSIHAISGKKVYFLSAGEAVIELDPTTGKTKTIIQGLHGAACLAVDKAGRIYVGLADPENQVRVFGPDGKAYESIGRPGGRARLGPWTPDGIHNCVGVTVDAEGKLWVAEADSAPKRISVWNTKNGAFVKEFFGPSTYGALGGAINPLDPNLMVGQGCEWRLDPKTGRAACLGSIHRGGMENARFGIGANKRLYLAVATRWAFDIGPLHIYERLGDATYKLRTTIFYVDKDNREVPPPAHGQTGKTVHTAIWCDENGDGLRQPREIRYVDGIIRLSGWYMDMTPDLSFYLTGSRYRVTDFTACGAPRYDLAKPETLPKPAFAPVGVLGSIDGHWLLYDGPYNVDHGEFVCYDLRTGKPRWTYPDNFVGVHGSHNAVPPEGGMIRGSFGPCGTANLRAPVGNVWVIATNVGEWHLLTESGYYLTRLFEGDPLKVKWPEQAIPGAVMDHTPPGMGGEDFGGSIAQGRDGKLYLQAGKTGFWNLEVVGLESVRELPGGNLRVEPQEVFQAQALREKSLQASVGKRRLVIKKGTPKFTGHIDRDFAGAEIAGFKKQDDAAVRVAAAWDAENLYLGWDVLDPTPWQNGADAPEFLYLGGDTVDFQLGTDSTADKKRAQAVLGDLRLSVGNFQGQSTAVVYRLKAHAKRPKTFSSGVIKNYTMDSVQVLRSAKILISKRRNGYLVEAALPLKALELQPKPGLILSGDFGVTHGDPAGKRTRLRTYWNNQHTGIVDDAVFELQMEPRYWGEIVFRE